MRVAIGIAQDPDPSLAAIRAVRQACRGVRRPDLALAFGGRAPRPAPRPPGTLRSAYTPHQVWAQVGESVARGEYEVADDEWSGDVLFMDVKGFTAFSESRPAAEVVRTLNAIFSPATRIIYECGGDVDKFIGDCIFAAFPDPRAAALAACRVRKLFDDLDPDSSPFAVRIGINAGRAVRANVGSPTRREYTFIGDAVNLAQRLESNATPGPGRRGRLGGRPEPVRRGRAQGAGGQGSRPDRHRLRVPARLKASSAGHGRPTASD